jgi:uncharacterized protein YjiK
VITSLPVDVSTDGSNKPEGLTLNDVQDILIVGEPNNYRFYVYSAP